MARQRDYKAEYARRVQRERERAAREGRPFSRAAARGHKRDNRETVNRQRRIRTLAKSTGTDPSDIRYARVNGVSDVEIERMLRDKRTATNLYKIGQPDYGHTRWSQRVQWLPVGFYYYHGD